MWVMESRTAASVRASIYYEVYGNGPCVMMIPGGWETHLAYYRNVPAFVQAGYTVITTNLRGHFQSPCKTGDLHFRHHPADILAVLDQEGIARATLIGWSMGGFGAVRLAVERPDRVAALVLMGSTAGLWSEQNYANNQVAVEKANALIAAGGPWPFDMTQTDTVDAFLRRQLQMLHSDDGFFPGPTAMLAMMTDRSVWLEPTALANFAVPTVFVGGDQDIFLPAGFQRHTVTLLPGAELGDFQDAGHNPHWEDADRFNASVLQWMRSKNLD